MILEWLAYIRSKNVAVQQEVCVYHIGSKVHTSSLGAQETGLSIRIIYLKKEKL